MASFDKDTSGSWNEWGRHVLAMLTTYSEHLTALEQKYSELNTEIQLAKQVLKSDEVTIGNKISDVHSKLEIIQTTFKEIKVSHEDLNKSLNKVKNSVLVIKTKIALVAGLAGGLAGILVPIIGALLKHWI